jgi:hypothetical protein
MKPSPLLRLLVVTAATLAACSAPEQVPLTPPKDAAGAAVVRKSIPEAAPQVAAAPATSAPAKPAPPVVVPAGTQYVCVSEVDGERKQTAIEFAPKVAQLCERHPEMGPCQYERNLCRRSGGRVFAAGGVEITTATEAEYDRKVLRVRFKAN